MAIDFETTMTETDFARPLLDATEERLVRETLGGADLTVEGLKSSLFSRLFGAVGGRGAPRG